MTPRFLIPALLMLATAAATAGFEEHRGQVLDEVRAEVVGHGRDCRPGWADCFPMAEVLFEQGKTDDGRRLAHCGLDALAPGNKYNRWFYNGNSGFAAWPGIDCYIRYEKFFDDALKEHFRKVYTGAVFYKRMTTSNHKLMAAVSRYLATQVWGLDAFHADAFFPDASGSVFAKEDPTGGKYVRAMMDSALRDAPGEYASRPYGAQNILPFLTLADCAKDPAIKETARQAYERCLFQLAPVWLGGHLATYSLRSYPDAMTQQPWGLGKTLWLYFGGLIPENLTHGYDLIAAVSPFRLPPQIERAATDRTKPYVHRALVSQWALYHFINRTYALFSRSPKPGKPWMNGQVYPCGVMWDEPDTSRASHLWITNPAADQSDDPKLRPDGIHTHGVSKFEREVQYRDALLAVFDIDPGYRFPYVLGYVPGGYRAAINDSAQNGRIFLHFGSVMICVSATQKFDWNPDAGIRAPAADPRAGDSEFRVMATKAAVAIETAPPDEFPGASHADQLAAFRAALLKKSKIGLTAPGADGTYVDRSGNLLECRFSGDDRINGRTVDYQHWPLLDNPWTSQQSPPPPLQ